MMPRPDAGWVYVLSHPGSERTKVGFSGSDPNGAGKSRIKHLGFILEAFGLGSLKVEFAAMAPNALQVENAVLRRLAFYKCGEAGSSREMFNLRPDQVVAALQSALAAQSLKEWSETYQVEP